MGVAFSLLRLTLGDRHADARGQRRHQQGPARRCRDRVVGPAPGRDQIPARQCGLRNGGAQVRRVPGQNTPVLPGRRGRVQRRPNIASGQGRVSQRKVTNARGEPAELGRGLQAGLGRGAGRSCVTLPRQRGALMREANRLEEPIVGGRGLGGHRAELCDGSSQIALERLCQTQAHAAVPRVGPVTDSVGEVASFFGGHARRDRVTGGDCCARLPGQNLAEPPLIVQLPGQFDRLGEVLSC